MKGNREIQDKFLTLVYYLATRIQKPASSSARRAFFNLVGLRRSFASINMYQENYEDGTLKCLHVFARTHNAPYKFFYRRWNEYQELSAWEKVQLDIRSVEDGDNSGVHLLPFVWKKRLFLFWPEFIKVQEAPGNSRQSVESLASDPNTVSQLEPKKHWEIKLAWSEYVDGKWSPKQLSKEFIHQDADSRLYPNESVFKFIADVDSENNLNIFMHYGTKALPLYWLELGAFHLSDISSKIKSHNLTFLVLSGGNGVMIINGMDMHCPS